MAVNGMIYVVATPIGNLGDITLRAIEILREVNFIAAEDTRHSQKLLQSFNISTPITSVHEFNEKERCDVILEKVLQGAKVALISDAGTPLISDPGYHLIYAAHQKGIQVSPVPGPCAAIAALCVSGLPTDRFVFEGFLPAKSKARRDRLILLREEPRTLIFYESPHRIVDSVRDMVEIFGDAREISITKELTKAFETVKNASLKDILLWLEENPLHQKGEFVLVVKGQLNPPVTTYFDEKMVLSILQSELPLKQAVSLCARITGQKKNLLYKQGLAQLLEKKE